MSSFVGYLVLILGIGFVAWGFTERTLYDVFDIGSYIFGLFIALSILVGGLVIIAQFRNKRA
jgi:hypothetical protein